MFCARYLDKQVWANIEPYQTAPTGAVLSGLLLEQFRHLLSFFLYFLDTSKGRQTW